MGSPISIDNSLNGLVLVGGKSSRMGTDKALLNYHGKTQIEYITELLTQFCSEVFVSAKQKTSYPYYPVIEDYYEFESPINGILSALKHSPKKSWLVVACDMPFIDSESIQHLIEHRDTKKLATYYQKQQDKPEPLFCIWEPSCYTQLLQYTNDGKLSPRGFLMNNSNNSVVPKNEKTLLNINSLEEYKQVKSKN